MIHALTRDAQGDDCRELLRQVRAGERSVLLTSVVAFEFTYAVRRYAKQISREEIGDYLVSLMVLPTVQLEDDLLIDAVRVWSTTPELGFVDAYLGIRAERDKSPVFTKNVKHFERFETEVPDPLSDYTP